jgi:excisionase family DNA binding protein
MSLQDLSEPLLVKPRTAEKLLNVSHAKLYELLNEHQIESFKCGKSRKITVSSIKAFIERRVAETVAAERAARITSPHSLKTPIQLCVTDASPKQE